ncbi:hypothetical protein [Pelomonas sp. Root1217]|uniref:hypothetical protein n=1 Tax=Pelomonas sp. Root1217 TaxID=1736430 RepID=UPI0009EB5964
MGDYCVSLDKGTNVIRLLPPGFALVRSLQGERFGRQRELIDELLSLGLLVTLRNEVKSRLQGSLDLREQFRDYFFDGRVVIPIRTEANRLVGFAGRHRPYSVEGQQRPPAKYLLTPGLRKADVLFNAHAAIQTLRNGARSGQQDPIPASAWVCTPRRSG